MDTPAPSTPSLVTRFREAIRVRHYSLRTERVYRYWIRKHIRLHGMRHPASTGGPEVTAFLSYLANEQNVAAATQSQALAALLFLYKAYSRSSSHGSTK